MAADDLPFMALLYASTRAEEVAATGWPAETQGQFLRQQFDAQHRHYMAHYPEAEWLIVERDGEDIGRLYVEETPARLKIVDISLIPAVRGCGIGGAMLDDLFAQAAGRPVAIHVEKNNPARRLYLRKGFELVADKGVYDLLEWRARAMVS